MSVNRHALAPFPHPHNRKRTDVFSVFDLAQYQSRAPNAYLLVWLSNGHWLRSELACLRGEREAVCDESA